MKRFFDYQCTSCGFLAEDIFIDTEDRDIPTQEPCPECGTDGTIQRLIGAPFLGDSVRQGRMNLPSTWTDKLSEMKSKHRHSTIKVQAPAKREI